MILCPNMFVPFNTYKKNVWTFFVRDFLVEHLKSVIYFCNLISRYEYIHSTHFFIIINFY